MRPYEMLEKEWAAFTGIDSVVACSSGTAALHIVLECLRLPPGSKVLVPDYTMVAVPRAVVLAGHVPVFADCDPLTLNIETGNVPGSESIKAAIFVATCGRRVGDRAFDWAHRNSCPVIEDLAEAHGLNPHPDSYAACWSFYRNKVVHGEEGGAVGFMAIDSGTGDTGDTWDIEHSRHARQLRSLGFTDAHDYTHVPRGHNYRLADLLAEPIRESIKQYTQNLCLRRIIEAGYEVNCPAVWRMPYRDVPWVYDIRIADMTRQQQRRAVTKLQTAGIPARYGFVPMTMQPEFRPSGPSQRNSSATYSEVIHLPVNPADHRPEWCRTAFDVIADAVSHES